MDLRQQLEQHFGSTYTIERELGGGGMSRVFVADEVRLGRMVVIKVLSPDLAQGLNAERFDREIKLAASLQQANIVPLLVAGEVAGIPWFTMPFVEGESLRHRLAHGAMPITEVVGILRDVTRALAYAHARGVVHRDIKPDNVLLSGGAAVVTDFGIAKAISASRTAAPGATLTQLGTSIGTPAYMAPEQVAGDPDIDHRVDLYALGCMTFELLTGQQPYANRTPQKMLAAHLSEAVPSASALRPETPAVLSVLASHLMAKDPGQRPQTANEVLQILDAAVTTSAPTMAFSGPGMLKKALLWWVVATAVVLLCAKAAIIAIGLPDWVFPGAMVVMGLGLPMLLVTAYVQRVARRVATTTPTLTPGGTQSSRMPSGTIATMAMKASPHVTWRRTRRGGIFAVGGFACVVVLFMATRAMGIGPWGSLLAAGKLGANDRIVLADFDVPTADSALAPIISAAVRAALSQSRTINLVPQTDIAEVLQEMKQSKDSPLNDPSLVHDVAQRAGAKAVLGGRLARLGAGYAVSLDLTAAQGGAVLASYQATAGSSQDLLSVIDGLTRKLRGKVGESLRQVQHTVPLERATTTSLDALRKYGEAVQANDIDDDYERAIRAAREAVALDSTFALAWRKLAVALFNRGGSAVARDSALQQAARYADRLPDREKYLVLGVYYEQSLTGADLGKAVTAYRNAYAADSSSTIATNELMLDYGFRFDFDSSVRYARRQLQIEPVGANVTRLALALETAGHGDEARTLLDSLAHSLAGADSTLQADLARGGLYVLESHFDSLEHLATVMSRSASSPIRLAGFGIHSMVPALTGRLTAAAAADSAFVTEARSEQLPGIFPLATANADILFRGRQEDGIRALDAIIAGPQWGATAPADRPYGQVIELYARAGNTARAQQLLDEYRAGPTDAKSPLMRPIVARMQGEIALAQGKTAEALQHFRDGLAYEDGKPTLILGDADFAMARAFDAGGQADSAQAYLEAYLAIPRVYRGFDKIDGSDATDLAAVEKRLGELYDTKHDTKNALAHYGAFVDLWKNADADLQPTVAVVRKRIADLSAQEGH